MGSDSSSYRYIGSEINTWQTSLSELPLKLITDS